MEDLLEVQPKSVRRCHVGRVSDCTPQEGIHSRSRLCPKIVKSFVCCRSITISIQTVCACVCASAVTMSQRSVSLSPAWCCCASMSQCCAGAATVTTASTRAWWKSSSLMSSDPSPVRLYRKTDYVVNHVSMLIRAYRVFLYK